VSACKQHPLPFVTRLLPNTPNPSLHRSSELSLEDIATKWTVVDDQSATDLSNFKKCDLQGGALSGTNKDEDDKLSIPMGHKMGLAIITLGTKNVYQTYTQYIPSTGGTSGGSGSKIITASNKFSGNVPYLYTTNNKYYFITKAGTSRTFSTTSTGITKWNSFSLNPTSGNYAVQTASVVWANDFYNYVWMYSHSGKHQTFSTTTTGTGDYKMECWGASGGATPNTMSGHSANPGKGGYTSGTIRLTNSTTLYVYVGGVGLNSTKTMGGYNQGGWNGGGVSSYNTSGGGFAPGSGGGGSTDIRILVANASNNTVWNNTSSLRTRIIVAGGGGGCGIETRDGNDQIGGCGGGLIGGSGTTSNTSSYNTANAVTLGGTQTTAQRSSYGPDESTWHCTGGFGYASQTLNNGNYYGCGGGGGWYGGQKGGGNGGAGGSSFISGHSGCDAVDTSTGSHKGKGSKITYGGKTYEFSGISMIDGDGYEWKANNANQTRVYQSATVPSKTTGTLVGLPTNPGGNNGYAKITFIPIED